MKVIDLLNKIANREEVPYQIKYGNNIYTRFQNINSNRLYYYQVLKQPIFLVEQLSGVGELLKEVEILEEEKKIEKIEKIGFVADGTSLYFNGKYQDGSIHGVTPKEIAFAIKINELIEEINKLKENKYE